MQAIDARDHAAFTLSLVERDMPGCFNVDGTPIVVREFLEACASAVAAHDVRFRWIAGGTLSELGVGRDELPGHLPFWSSDDSLSARLDVGSAIANGLELRPIADIACSVLASRRDPTPTRRYMTAERESELLRVAVRKQ